MLRILLTKPRKKRDPINGLVLYRDGHIVSQAVLQERRNKNMKWENVPIINEEDAKDGY